MRISLTSGSSRNGTTGLRNARRLSENRDMAVRSLCEHTTRPGGFPKMPEAKTRRKKVVRKAKQPSTEKAKPANGGGGAGPDWNERADRRAKKGPRPARKGMPAAKK